MRAGHPPRMGDLYPRIEAIRWRNQANLTIGVESHAIGGSEVRITNPTRTAVDVWRYSVLNKAMPSRAQRITDETCADVFSRYRSAEHTPELQSLMRISYAVFCLT